MDNSKWFGPLRCLEGIEMLAASNVAHNQLGSVPRIMDFMLKIIPVQQLLERSTDGVVKEHWLTDKFKMWTVLGATGVTVGILLVLRQIFKTRSISLQGKVVLITGASSGLGEACAHVFYKAGAKLILSARRKEELERVKRDVQQNTTNTATFEPEVLPLDLTDFDSLPGKVKTAISFHGKIDVLVNNGGISSREAIVDTPLEVDQSVMNVNYFGQVALTKAVLPYMMKERSGHILAVSSIQGRIAIPFRSSYAASKHAVQAFFDCLRSEMAEYNIGVSVFSPGYIKTSLSLNALKKDGQPAGVMEKEIATGMSAESAAQLIMKAITNKQQDLLVGPLLHRLAVYGRVLVPTLFAQIMAARATKQRKLEAKNT